MQKVFLMGVAIILVITGAVASLLLWQENNQPIQRACSMIAKQCPDGKTYVSRTGPNCEFAECPEVKE